ncbi:hypothetical protein GW17_00057712, partial [Ensete ventricosum]
VKEKVTINLREANSLKKLVEVTRSDRPTEKPYKPKLKSKLTLTCIKLRTWP